MMRHGETGRDTLITAERSAATERVRTVPVTLVAEPSAPLCACPIPRHSWSDVRGNNPRYAVWFCGGCLTGGFIAFPGADDWSGIFLPRDLSRQRIEAPLNELAEALGETVDAVGLFVRHADDLLSRRARHGNITSITADLKDGIAQTVAELKRRFDAAERDRSGAECQRQIEHAELMKRLRRQVRQRTEAVDRSLARRKPPAASSTYAVIVRGAEVVRQLIYGLVDPAAPDRIRYVGKTTAGAHSRFLGHISGARSGAGKRADWIAALAAEGRYPDMVLLEDVGAGVDLDARERWWITAMRERDEADLNTALPKVTR